MKRVLTALTGHPIALFLGLALAVGALLVPEGVGRWVALAALVGLFVKFLVLIASTRWWTPLAWALLGLFVVGLSSALTEAVVYLARRTVTILAGVEFVQPWWLLLLLSIPVFFLLSRRNLGVTGLDVEERKRLRTALLWLILVFPYGLFRVLAFLKRRSARVPSMGRRWMGFALRCVLVVSLSLALAEPRLAVPYENTTVLFVLDRSLSIPEELDGTGRDLRWERVRQFLNNAVKQRPIDSARDKAGLIVFGRRPRLELLPGDASRLGLTEITSQVDGNYTDIGAAIQLALASFPENAAKRIVLISDGNENRGSAKEQAELARLNGVEIDVLPLAANRRNENEVLVERVEAPSQIEQGTQVPIRVWVRSHCQQRIVGTLIVRQISESRTVLVEDPPPRVVLELGLKSFSFKQPLGAEQESYTYEAEFQPEGILDADDKVVVRGLPGDRVQNNRATTHVVARGRRRVLFLEATAGEHKEFVDKLRTAGQSKFRVEARTVDFLDRFQERDRLSAFLSNFDCVILANIPADLVSEEQQEALRANTHDQGCGLVVIGGPESYGAGGWQNTPVEKAMPVDADIKDIEVEDKCGLVLVMHASEMAEGNMWQKKIAKLAIERLSPRDELGVLHYSWNVNWHIPLQEVGTNRSRLLRQIDRLEPGDMPDFDPALKMAHKALTEQGRGIARKHVIIISDGDPVQSDKSILRGMRRDKVTVSTVGVATHGPALDQAMMAIANATGGRSYFPKRPSELPAIYIRETRLVSRSFVEEKLFKPVMPYSTAPTAGLPKDLPPLRGFVRTSVKPSRLVEVPLKKPAVGEQEFPLLAHWPYGLGKSAAFTSDAGRPKLWCEQWVATPLYAKFWEQLVEWSLRPVESKNLVMTAHFRDGRIKVVVEARTEQGEPDLYLRSMRAEVTPPRVGIDAPRKPELRFEQKSGGLYEAECKAEEAGSYFIAMQATRKVVRDGKEVEERESIRCSVTIPYAPEFGDMQSDPDLLERLREQTGGERYADDAVELAKAAKAGTVFRPGPAGFASLQPVWYWLVFASAVLLLFDVAVRRIAVERLEITPWLRRLWAYLRDRTAPMIPAPVFLDRLQSRKAQVNQEIERTLGARRFEAGDTTLSTATSAADAPEASPSASRPEPQRPAPPQIPEATGEPADFASRLLRAKKRVWEERDENK